MKKLHENAKYDTTVLYTELGFLKTIIFSGWYAY